MPVGRVGRDDYYRLLQQCRIVLSFRGLGLDTFRFWENAAMNAVHFSEDHGLLIPQDFTHGQNIMRFKGAYRFRAIIDELLEQDERRSALAKASREHLRAHHLTTSRAQQFFRAIQAKFS